MSVDIQQASSHLRALRAQLVADYNDEDLHQLRVTLRRMRSALRGKKKGKVRKLRRRLGALARTTNAARDWDTLCASASVRLGQDQFGELQPLLHERRESARAQVYRMFHSKKWLAALRCWDASAGDVDPGAENLRTTPGVLETRRKRANAAAARAMTKDRDKRWHELRIAVKELRYALDNRTEGSPENPDCGLLDECKDLQALLGDWHDTVVHRQLLAGLAVDCSLDTSSPAGRAAEELQQALAGQGQASLEAVRQQLRRGEWIHSTVS